MVQKFLLGLLFVWPLTIWATPQALLKELDGIRADLDVASVALTLVDRQGVVFSDAAGLADRATGRVMTADTPVRIGSITKSFNGLLAQYLSAQDRLCLDCPLRPLLPNAPLDNPWEKTDPVRVVHLLEHTAGLSDLVKDEWDHNTPFPDHAAALEFRPDGRLLRWRPGLHRSYSNVGAGYFGALLERQYGQPYQETLRNEVLRPLGMNKAYLYQDGAGDVPLAQGYDSDGHTPIPYWHMIFPALGAVNATPREMGLFVHALANRQFRGLSPTCFEGMERPHSTLAARAGLAFGYGLGIDAHTRGRLRLFGHTGDGDGYLSRMAYHPESGKGYFLTINAFKHSALRELSRVVEMEWFAGLGKDAPAIDQRSKRERQALVGHYVPVTYRFRRHGPIEIEQADDRLWIKWSSGRRLPIVAQDRWRYRHPREPVATMAFVAHQGQLYLQTESGNYRQESPEEWGLEHWEPRALPPVLGCRIEP